MIKNSVMTDAKKSWHIARLTNFILKGDVCSVSTKSNGGNTRASVFIQQK